MAQGRCARIDGQNSSNYCLIICIVGFASMCVVGAWMTMSSSIGPVRTGISVEKFMGGMPKVVRGGDNELNEDASSRNSLPVGRDTTVQGIENAVPKEPQSLHNDENQKTESKEENMIEAEQELNPEKVKDDVVSGDGEENNGAKERESGDDETNESQQTLTSKTSDAVAPAHDDDDVKAGPMESPDELKQIGDTETSPQPQVTPWPTQAAESENEKLSAVSGKNPKVYSWKVCNVTAGPDYIPCLDNIQAVKMLRTTRHYEHRERHCPHEAPTCLVPLPKGYRNPVKWPKSRDMIWFVNVPHTKLVEYKGKQNWVKVYDRYLTFPGGGTQFKYGALHYVDYLQQTVPGIAWGKRSRVVLDVGCGVASFGGYLFDRDVLTMSLAPKDEHEAQIQFALERGIPAISAVMGTRRLPFPSKVFDIVHCARCRVPWHIEGGKLLLELDRLLRPGGYFVWSATPVYRKGAEDASTWKEMSKLTKSLCWELVKIGKDGVNRKSAAIFRKSTSNDCYEEREQNDPPLCEESDDPNKAWYTPLQQCIHKLAKDPSERGSQWPAPWPSRLEEPPYWLKGSAIVSSENFTNDYNHWKHVIASSYLNWIGIDWSLVRNVMDMKASYGGFAAALKDMKLWVMNVLPVYSSDTLPIIYERGLFGIYHDWCESFSTYPRSYDLLHADHVFSDLNKRCNIVSVMAEVDRILRPGGRLIVRDDAETISEVRRMAKSLHWKITHNNENEGLLCVMKTLWRPSDVETITGAIA